MSIYSKRIVWCVIVTYFTLAQVVIGQTTRHCIKEADYCFTITLPQDNDTLVHFRLEAPNTVGWLGLGIGEGMDGYLMVAWPNDDNTITLSQREGENGVQPFATNYQDDLQMLNTSSANENNKFIVEFTRPLTVRSSKGTTIQDKQVFAYAYATINPQDKSVNAYLPVHDYNDNIKLDLENGGSELAPYDKLIIAHASLMFGAWLVIIPIAIFIVRFGRNIFPTTWFKLHVGIQALLSIPVILAGSSLSFVAAGSILKFNDPHQIIGFVLFLGFFVQFAIGLIHHHLYDKNRGYTPWWTKLHWWFGRALVILAIFQIPLGLSLYGAKSSYFSLYYIYLFVLLVTFTFSSFRLWSKSRQSGGFIRMPEQAHTEIVTSKY